MLDTQTIMMLCVRFCEHIHVSVCQKFCFRNSSLSKLVSEKRLKRCWWLWNVNIDIAFNYSYTDL